MPFSNSSKLLITGGTGSFKAFLRRVLNIYPNIKRIVIFSRDELKQWELRQIYPEDKYPQLRFFLGDIRDRERLKRALEDIDTVIHAAALKQVPAAEYNPMEFVKTNVLGAENLIEACIYQNVKRVIALAQIKQQLLSIYMVQLNYVQINYLLQRIISKVIVIFISV